MKWLLWLLLTPFIIYVLFFGLAGFWAYCTGRQEEKIKQKKEAEEKAHILSLTSQYLTSPFTTKIQSEINIMSAKGQLWDIEITSFFVRVSVMDTIVNNSLHFLNHEIRFRTIGFTDLNGFHEIMAFRNALAEILGDDFEVYHIPSAPYGNSEKFGISYKHKCSIEPQLKPTY